jgi:pre-mRNA-splicing factor ATP-dependent RNA helicase DHX15/PRP43
MTKFKYIKDILDSKGKKKNFLNENKYSNEYKLLGKSWSKLPLYEDEKKVKDFFKLLDEKQVILLVSGTGSGKTVLVPKFVLKYVVSQKLEGKIAVTNPKSLTTKNNAIYGASTLDVKLGEEVGYKFKGAPDDSSSDKSKLLYVTDGLILAKILSGDKLLKDYQCVIIDEAHERNIQIDILLKMLKEVLYERPDFKLIIMSATINSKVFKNYFDNGKLKYGEIEVSGKSNYPIDQHFLEPKEKVSRGNYVEKAVERCFKIINSDKEGDIIVFIATTNDAIKGCKLLKETCPVNMKTKCNETYCVEVYANMKDEDKELAINKDLFKKTNIYKRKVIFATNVAESSITFDGLVFVIDSGYELKNYYDVKDNATIVSKMYTSQAQIKQRIGRAGRTQPGVSYHLYSKDAYDKFKQYPEPNITVTDITDFILSFIKYAKTINKMLDIIEDFITIPSLEQVITALHKLHFMDCIKIVNLNDDKLSVDKINWSEFKSFDDIKKKINGTITSIGIYCLYFRSSPITTGIALFMSKHLNCYDEMLKMIAILEITDGKISDLLNYKKKESNNVINYFSNNIVEYSDFLTVLSIYNNNYKNNKTTYLNLKTFKLIDKRIDQLDKTFNKINENLYSRIIEKYNINQIKVSDDLEKNFTTVLFNTFKFNLIKKVKNNMYKSVNFLNNSQAECKYNELITDGIFKGSAICYQLSNIFGQKIFTFISEIN